MLTTLTLTFGLDMILYNFMTLAFTATPRRIALDLGRAAARSTSSCRSIGIVAMVLALALTGLLFLVLRSSTLGRAIVAVRMDRDAAALMGIRVDRIYARHLRHRRADGGRLRQPARRRLSGHDEDGRTVPRQGVRRLRHRRAGQRARRAGRRPRARA